MSTPTFSIRQRQPHPGEGEHEEGVDENNKGPMFPKLHVNHTEKGGPRAPPRNKMALYEQLSVPSQRLNGHFEL
ncbi:hypothetical protein LXL04_017021 [Taraxacum kok-saghyz]